MELKNISDGLLPELLRLNFGETLFTELEKNRTVTVKGYAGSAPSVLAAEYFIVHKKTVLFLVNDKEEGLYITAEMEELVGQENVLYFPPSYLEPYQVEKVQNANLVLRTEVLNALNSASKARVIVAPFAALSEKVLQQDDFKAITHTVKVGDLLDFEFLLELLTQYDFHQTDFVSEPGEFSLRGGILDVFSYSGEQPYRITFFGREVESIKIFDLETQLSKSSVPEFQLVSNMNFTASGTKISFFDLLQTDSIVISKDAYLGIKRIRDFFAKAEQNFGELSTTLKHQPPAELFISEAVLTEKISSFPLLDFTKQQFFTSGLLQINQQPQPVFNKNFEMLAHDLKEKKALGYQTWISFSSEKQKDRLESILEELNHDVSFRSFKSELHEGFVDADLKISVYTDHQIFDRFQRFKAKNNFAKSDQLTLKDMMSLKVGDYIAHIDHGIGKFMGLVKINNNGKVQECFKLVYKNQDLLYVSIHSLDKISKYNGPDGKEIVLSKLGSPAWKSLKQKTRAKVKQIAFDLIKLYAQRKTAKGFSYAPDSYLQNELEASFIYEDTPDQEKATNDVKKDMEAQTVMDRLVCGDVGFGKTEVAIRAAFK